MEEVFLTETETRYYSDLFLCCDVEKTGKIPMLKATELFRSANISDEVLNEITSLASVPAAALHISRAQFYSCLKLIAAHQAAVPLRQELLVATAVALPLPRFSWKDSPSVVDGSGAAAVGLHVQTNGSLNPIPPPPGTDRKNSLTRRQEVRPTSSRRNSAAAQQQQQQEAAANSDVQSTDSEVEQNESSCGAGGGGSEGGVHGSSSRELHRRRAGSPEAWSTNSDSPTPTNSVAERPWAKENLWHGLLGDEHRQLLGTEEESSDRHSSDDDDNETELETVYQITPEQREYYYKQFKAVQHDPNGLLSGQVARVFFEKSRIPVEELRHIWQLCDVTRDGALSLAEFTAAMHLVVLRRNNIPLPTALPACLHPNVLQHSTTAAPVQPQQPQEPPEADLLHLNDDDDDENTENTIKNAANTTVNARVSGNEKNVMNMSNLSTSSQASTQSRQAGGSSHVSTPPLPAVMNRSIPNSPHAETTTSPSNLPTTGATFKNKDRSLWTTDVPPTQWTKFTESPTSNVSSPGPKPVNFDMQRTAQAVVSDPQILHPVPLRVTPVAGAVSNSSSATITDVHNQEAHDGAAPVAARSNSPKQMIQTIGATVNNTNSNSNVHHRDSLQQQTNDLRAIQRPQAKKLPAKNVGAIPPPPQREPSVGSASSSSGIIGGLGTGGDADISGSNNNNSSTNNQQSTIINKKEAPPPPLPPPRPHRHGRSSSLDLNKFKMSTTGQPLEIAAQTSFDLQTSTGFADFTQFPDDAVKNANEQTSEQQQHSLPPQQQHIQQTSSAVNATNNTATTALSTTAALPLSRFSLQSNQRVSAFEVYRKPHTPRNSQSPPLAAAAAGTQHQPQPLHPPPPAPFGAAGAAAIAGAIAPSTVTTLPNADAYEKRVNAITETLRHVSFKTDSNMTDILRHLREQNSLLLHLCNDLSDELLSVQTRKEELRLKLETNDISAISGGSNTLAAPPVARTGSSISAPVTANITGGSGSSGVHSNV